MALTLTVGTTFVESTSQTSHSFSASLGTATPDRLVIVAAVSGGSGASISAITIGGSAATIHAYANEAFQSAAIGSLLVPSGTTATVAFTTDSATDSAEAVVYQLTGSILTPTGAAHGDTLETIPLRCAVGPSGVLIGASHGYLGPLSTASNALGTADLTGQDYGGDMDYLIGHSTGLSASNTYQVTFSNSAVNHAAVIAAWKPTAGVGTRSKLIGS